MIRTKGILHEGVDKVKYPYPIGTVLILREISIVSGKPTRLNLSTIDTPKYLFVVTKCFMASAPYTKDNSWNGGVPIMNAQPGGSWVTVENNNGKAMSKHAYWFQIATNEEVRLFNFGFKSVRGYEEAVELERKAI